MTRGDLVGALVVSAVLSAVSCRVFEVPGETCSGASIHQKRVGDELDPSCSRCLEDACCDDVGRCEQAAGCADLVSSAQACVLAAGPRGAEREGACTDRLTGNALAGSAYGCMRRACGETCGLPVCAVTPEADLVGSRACDRCFAGACCAELNACHANRTCKLTVECMVQDCGAELASALRVAEEALGRARAAVCAGAELPPETLPPCVAGCIDGFRAHPQGPPTEPEREAACLAASVHACATRAGCATSCGDGSDALAP